MDNVITEILSQFSTLDLKELDAVNLLERRDFKFCFHENKLPFFLENMLADYEILKIGKDVSFEYVTKYFDTPDFKFYFNHHNEFGNRLKTRSRYYVQTNMHFAEIKSKNNRSITIKERKKISDTDGEAEQYLEENINKNLELKCMVYFRRFTFLNKNRIEKITLDTDLKFTISSVTKSFDGLCIAEVKCKNAQNSPFQNLMKQNYIYQSGLSKYCMAITQLYPDLKQNNFKPTLLQIHKILA